MNSILDFLNDNRWLNLIFLVLALGSILVSVYLFLKSRKRKIPTYLMKTFNLFKDKVATIEKVKITYSDNPIENLSITKVSIWNRGNDVINFSDVAPKNPIMIKASDKNEILDAQIVYNHNTNNNFHIILNEDKKTLEIKFDYFYKNEGIVLEVYHNGTTGKDIKLEGSLKDVPKLLSAHLDKDFLLDWIFDNSFGLPRKHMSDKIWKIYFICIVPILLPIFFVAIPLQKVYGLIKKPSIPNEFSLTDEE